MLEGLIARLGLQLALGHARKLVRRVPWQAWATIGAVALLLAAAWWHQHRVQALYDRAYAAGRADERKSWKGELAKARKDARTWREKYEAEARALNIKIGENHALENRLIAARADDLLMRGPGRAAACPGSADGSGHAAGAGGSVGAAGKGDAPLAPVPAEQPMAIVPWSDLVTRARAGDAALAEAATWRTWYVKNAELLRKAKLALPKPFGAE